MQSGDGGGFRGDGHITDLRTLELSYPRISDPDPARVYDGLIVPPSAPEQRPRNLAKEAGDTDLPDFDPIPGEPCSTAVRCSSGSKTT